MLNLQLYGRGFAVFASAGLRLLYVYEKLFLLS